MRLRISKNLILLFGSVTNMSAHKTGKYFKKCKTGFLRNVLFTLMLVSHGFENYFARKVCFHVTTKKK